MKSLVAPALTVALTLSACSGQAPSPKPEAGQSSSTAAVKEVPALDQAGWTSSTYAALTDTINGSAGQGKIAVFDFDNTTQARDVSEAMLAQAQESNSIPVEALSAVLYPPFTSSDGSPVTIGKGVYDYYEALLDSGGDADPFREYSSLPMPSSVFAGRTVADFVATTSTVYDGGSGLADLKSGKQSKILGAGRPFIYPQMADLYGNLRSHGYDVWVVSAGITWAVRWMVQNAVNPAIVAKYGKDAALPLDHVIAVNTLMRDRTTGKLVSDYELTRKNPDQAYIDLDPARLSQLEVLAVADGLTSWRGGKTGAIDNIITRGELFLVGGDSFGDVEMLNRATNRLVISRMNKPDLAAGFADEIKKAPDANWILQPTINSAPVGFVSTKCEMATKTAADTAITATTNKSLATLDGTGRLGSFTDC